MRADGASYCPSIASHLHEAMYTSITGGQNETGNAGNPSKGRTKAANQLKMGVQIPNMSMVEGITSMYRILPTLLSIFIISYIWTDKT